MISKRAITAILAISGLATACATSSTELNKVHSGIDKTKVEEILGEPESTSVKNDTEIMIYKLTPQGNWFKTKEYWVMLRNNQVYQFGRPGDW